MDWTFLDMRRLPTRDFLTKESSPVDKYTLNVIFTNDATSVYACLMN
ncbi:DUF5412 family protein [Peribacillus sp. NPDC096540]